MGKHAGKQASRKRRRDEQHAQRPANVYHCTADGVRHVRPYVYEFRTNAKGRWVGRTLLDVFTTEFGAYPYDYYHHAIISGRISVNNSKVSPDYVVRSGDLIIHSTHRHEVCGCARARVCVPV